jgi:hypothetical protein
VEVNDKSGGVEPLIFQDERDRDRRRKSDQDPENGATRAPAGRKRKSAPTEVGDALRSVYQRAIDEDIPPEMLDLLGKLG